MFCDLCKSVTHFLLIFCYHFFVTTFLLHFLFFFSNCLVKFEAIAFDLFKPNPFSPFHHFKPFRMKQKAQNESSNSREIQFKVPSFISIARSNKEFLSSFTDTFAMFV
jgi:hypothetical protein